MIIIILFVAIPFIMALLANVILTLLFPLKKMNSRADNYDKELVQFPSIYSSVENIRNNSHLGDKIVFTHFVMPKVKEYGKNFKKTVIKTLLIEFVVLVICTMSAASKNPDSSHILFDAVDIFLRSTESYYLTPIGIFAIYLESIYYYFFLNEEISKHSIS